MDIYSIALINLLASLVRWDVGIVDVVADVVVETVVDTGVDVDAMGIEVMGIASILAYFPIQVYPYPSPFPLVELSTR